MNLLGHYFKRYVLIPAVSIIAIIDIIFGFTYIVSKPSNSRDWSPDQAILPYADINGSKITIHNIRNFTYRSTTDYTANYYKRTYNLADLNKVYYIVEPFSGQPDAAHTFLSFQFDEPNGPQFVAISIEIRKEKGESFSAVKGLFNQYEIMYVIADELDVVKLRSNFRKDKVFVYPIKTSPAKSKELFLNMIERVNTLKNTPEFYNTIFNNCTNNIARHVNHITPKLLPLFSLNYVFPANSDKMALNFGLLDVPDKITTIEQAREIFIINDRANEYANSQDFSLKIRQF